MAIKDIVLIHLMLLNPVSASSQSTIDRSPTDNRTYYDQSHYSYKIKNSYNSTTEKYTTVNKIYHKNNTFKYVTFGIIFSTLLIIFYRVLKK